ncbi:MAG TPA: methyltransferase [Phenylobacterium sp.]|nr:methyltransferase [Phenylobacterium sp.]
MLPLRDTPRLRLILDGFERVVVTALFAWLAIRIVEKLPENPVNLIFLASEAVVACMVLLRRPAQDISLRPLDWAISFAGTFLIMLAMPTAGGWPPAGILLLAGLAISLGAKLSLRRSFGVVAANRGVKTDGLYTAVRHPMYLGYFIGNLGMLLANPSAWNFVIVAAWTVCQLMRIAAEERILLQDDRYRAHAAKVRFRLIPFVY